MVLHYNSLDYINYVIVQGILPSCFGARHVVSAFFRFKAKEIVMNWYWSSDVLFIITDFIFQSETKAQVKRRLKDI
jgi:hypothetical protein